MDGKRMIENGIKYLVVKVEENTNLITLLKPLNGDAPMNWDGPVMEEQHPAIYIYAEDALVLCEDTKKAKGLIEILDNVWQEEEKKCL